MMAVARARLFLDDDHDDVPLAPPAAPPAPCGAPPPPPPQVEEEGEEAEQQDEAADEAAAPSFSCLALWRPNRLRSPARARHRRLSRHRAARSLACSFAEAVGCAASREVSLGTRPRKEFAWLDLRTRERACAKGAGVHCVLPCRHRKESLSPGLQNRH